MPDGKYKVINVGLFDGSIVQFDKLFTIQSGKIMVGGKQVDHMNLNLQEGVRE
ncbi:hypothetical protein [Bacillus sp. 165]|uniref:hypothetical protein n=1 Tax=Bacillus sp. 165 TaxID=1529117 RepID=UPI001ADAD409|nr:hypothetical protein [Bacillus sp. 165]MBO9130753.1 hypothetical protein [Bacillus sp. 165]